MTVVQFIKQYGWGEAKIHLEELKKQRVISCFFNDLKQLVDAWELVNRWNGVDAVNELIAWEMEHHTNGGNGNKDLPNKKVIDRLKQAIELVESVK